MRRWFQGGTVINADSMQLYADLQVLTARPDDCALRCAPHRLYGVIDGAERASVGSWLAMAAEAMAAARAAGKLPIIVGGTGMYINAGLNGLAKIPDVPKDIHAFCVEQLAEMGGNAFRAELANFDPVGADRLFASDSQRLVRAMGVVRATVPPLVTATAIKTIALLMTKPDSSDGGCALSCKLGMACM